MIPMTAESAMIRIGCFFLKDNMLMRINKHTLIAPGSHRVLTAGVKTVVPMESREAAISPMTAGLRPVIAPSTIRLLLNRS